MFILNLKEAYYKYFLGIFGFIIFMFIYNCISSIYLFLPPLFGVYFLYFSKIIDNKRYYSLLAFSICLFICEADKGYYSGVLLVIYIIIYITLFPKIMNTFKDFNIVEFIYVPIIYIAYIALNDFLILLSGDNDIKIIIPMLFWYICIESFIVLVIRWILGIK